MKPDFDKMNGLAPAIIQDASSHKVLMLGFMNKEALSKTQKEGKVTFYSRSKQRLWTKGETSGNYLMVKEIIPDCDNDTLLIKAIPQGPVCHTGSDTCFDEKNELDDFLFTLEQVIQERKTNPSAQSYTSQLLLSGIDKIAQKVGEEAVELVIEAKNDDRELFKNEAADLLYHLLVLFAEKEVPLSEVLDVLRQRHR